MDSNQQLALFLCSDICTEKVKKGKKEKVKILGEMEKCGQYIVGLCGLQRNFEVSELTKLTSGTAVY